MNKNKILIGFIVLLITVGVLLIPSGYIRSANSNMQLFKFKSQETALLDGISQNMLVIGISIQ